MAALHIFLAFLLNSILQIFFVAAIAWGCSLVARRARAGIRHAIWVLALLASTLLPVLSLTVAHGRGLAVQSARWNQIDQFRQKIDNSLWVDGDGVPGANVAPKGSRLRLLASALLVFYFLFLAHRFGRLALRWRRTRHMLEAAGTGGISDRVAAVAEECKRQLGAQSVSIVCSAAAAVPFTAGAFRPIVVLPHSLLKTTSDDELRVAIGHELAHVYRHDYLLNILYELVSLPVAFHPCVLWMKRQIEKNRETACDEMAARCLESPTGYARALMSLARALPQPPVATMASSPALGVFDGNNLEKRIMQLLDKTPRLSARAAGAVFAFSFLLLFATCVVGYSFALTPGQDASQSSAAGQPNLSGVWTGRLEEKLPDGRVGHGSLYLRLQQSGDQITGVVGDTQTTTSPVENVILSGSHLKFSAGAPGGPKGPVLWTLELDVKGDAMEGTGHAFRGTDNHSWDVEIKLTRNK